MNNEDVVLVKIDAAEHANKGAIFANTKERMRLYHLMRAYSSYLGMTAANAIVDDVSQGKSSSFRTTRDFAEIFLEMIKLPNLHCTIVETEPDV